MRQVLSWRFVAAIGALVALTVLLAAVLLDRDTVARVADRSGRQNRRIDLISIVLESETRGFAIRRDGRTRGRVDLELLDNRSATIFPGTPGTSSCERHDAPSRCAIFAETLGDTIVWFAFLPIATNFEVELPAIVDLSGGYAQLANGWEVPYAPVIDRSRCDTPAESFSEFLDEVGRRHRAIYSFARRQITAVSC